MQGVWNSYLDAKHAAGAEYPDPALEESDPAGFEAAYKAWEEAIDWSKVKNRTVYIGPEAYSLYTTSFGVFQGPRQRPKPSNRQSGSTWPTT